MASTMTTASSGPSSPGVFTEALGQLAFAFSEVQPFLGMYLHLVVSALFPIFTGAHASLVRPATALKPKKKKKKKTKQTKNKERGDDEDEDDDEDDEDDEDDDEFLHKMEGLSPSDAIVFPVLAGSTLAGLYFLIKWMGAAAINKVLGWYFSSIAVFSVAKLLHDGFAVLESFCWPEYYVDEGVIWRVASADRGVFEVGEDADAGAVACSRTSPLPGILGRVRLPPAAVKLLWLLRDLPSNKYCVRAHVAKVVSFKIKLTVRTVLCTALGLAVVLVANFVSKAWWLTNIQGFAFSYSALQLMSPTTFGTGSLILAALFFYDIYFVFYTPMMVSVATNLDVPIKLLFPRPAEEGQTVRKLAMLGLGDIVLPGIMIGLALRFDLWMHYLRKQTKSSGAKVEGSEAPAETVDKERYRSVTGHWGNSFWTTSWTGKSRLLAVAPLAIKQPSVASRNALIPTFPKPYFYASVFGYVAGMCTTLGIMQVFHHAQPALLYLVPGVLSSLWLTGAVRGELKEMREFSEASEEEEDEDKKKDAKEADDAQDKKDGNSKNQEPAPSWWSRSFFSSATAEKNAKRIEKQLAKNISTGAPDTSTEGQSKVQGGKGDNQKSTSGPDALFLFSVTRVRPQGSSKKTAASKTKLALASGPDDADDVLLASDTNNTSSVEQTPRWRGARVSEETKDQRPEKRLRTS